MNSLKVALLLLPLLLLSLLLSGCAKEAPPAAPPQPEAGPLSTVVLLADPDGHVGRVVVSDRKGESVVLDKEAYAVHVDSGRNLTKPERMSPAEIEREFGKMLRALPEPPVTFILHFRGKTATLTRESQAMLKDIAEAFRERNSTDVSIVGHTDRSGDPKYNMLVSEKRAQKVSKLLFKKYRIPWMTMEVISHGEKFPLEKIGDGKTSKINQRVEVTIR